jgi:hypothetical protein
MLMAGDVGGTKTEIAIYSNESGPHLPLVAGVPEVQTEIPGIPGEAGVFSVSEPAGPIVGTTVDYDRRIRALGIAQSERPEPGICHRQIDRRV